MTAPKLEQTKFWIVKPKEATNQIKNPAFAVIDFEEDWTASGAGVTIEETGDHQRREAYSMQVNTATGVASGAYYAGLTVVSGSDYTFSCDVKGVTGQAMRIYIADVAGTVKATTTWTATGYWQRKEVTHTAAESKSDYRAYVIRDAVASTDAYYVDGCQFEQASAASTFFNGYTRGCRWTGAPRNSSSYRPATTRYGGELICINDYAKIVGEHGFSMGQWNQIMTKMTSGGDMYQGAVRKSRNVSLVLAYDGENQGDLQANRKVILDAVRPDLLEGQEMILRYQGFDANGNEATNPVDIVCVFQPSHNDTPDMPVYNKDILSFTVPSGLFEGAYNDGRELDLYANFPAEYIVKRDPQGNWCTWDGITGTSLITGLNGTVYCMAEGPDGKIYVGGEFTDAGGVANADYLARWNGTAWEAVVAGISNYVMCMAFDSNGDLYVGGNFTNLGSANGNWIVKITDLIGTPTINALGTGLNNYPITLAVSPNGDLYVGGAFSTAGGVSALNLAKWNGSAWSALGAGLSNNITGFVTGLAFDSTGNLYIAGLFQKSDNAVADYLCYWDGAAFHGVGTVDPNNALQSLAFDDMGRLYIGGQFTNMAGIANADHVARWNGSGWEALGIGANDNVYRIFKVGSKMYMSGAFTSAGGLTLTDRVAIWSNGAWSPLDIDLPGTGYARTILPVSDGSLYIGGSFSTVAETPDENAKTGVVALNLNLSSASANTYPFIQVFGPGTLKAITNYSTGKTIAFDGLTIQAGEHINLLFDPLNLQFYSVWGGRGNIMRYIVAGSDYGDFYFMPGTNLISLFMTDTTSATSAFAFWTPRFWGLDGALL